MFQKTPKEFRSEEVQMNLAVDNTDLTIKDWIKNRPYPMSEEDRLTLKLILAIDHTYKELIRYGKRK